MNVWDYAKTYVSFSEIEFRNFALNDPPKMVHRSTICVPDSTLNTIDTPHGKVEFLEFIGMTDAELKTLNTVQSVKDIYTKIGSDVTDYARESYV